MPEKDGMNRRDLLRMAAGAGVILGGVGQVTGTHSDSEMRIDNGTFDVRVGETDSHEWYFDGSDDLYSEDFALNEAGGTTQWGYDGTVVQSFPDHGTPGTEYTCSVAFTVSGVNARVDRTVWLDPSDPLLEITYEITNEDVVGFNDLRFFQYMDYDIDWDTSDNADYVPDPQHVYQEDVSSGQAVGFAGTELADRYDVDQYGDVDDSIEAGELPNRDWDFQGETDNAAALQWNLGSLAPGESSSPVTVQFAAGFSRTDIEGLLATNEVPTAVFSYDPSSPVPHEDITFDASASMDPDGSIVEYAWDFDDDGTFEVLTSSPQTTHSFPTPGSYDVTLQVTDDDGATSTAVTRTVPVDTEAIDTIYGDIGPPVDCDGDGRFEDVTGDGEVDLRDIFALRHMLHRHNSSDSWSLTEAEQAMFDFNEDGTFDGDDIATLNQQILEGTACPDE